MGTMFTLAALIGGTVLVFQFVLLLLGLSDGGEDLAGGADLAGDADLGEPGGHWFYEVLSLRTLSAAVTFFGLAGKTAMAYGHSQPQSLVIASLAGLAALYGVYWLFKQVYKLQHSGNENVRNAIGMPATVYVPIPGNRSGAGKVTFRLQSRLVEYQAVTDDEQRLATGEKVVVVAVVTSDTVRVSRAAAAIPDTVSSA